MQNCRVLEQLRARHIYSRQALQLKTAMKQQKLQNRKPHRHRPAVRGSQLEML